VAVTAGYNTAPIPTNPVTTVSQGDSKQCSNIYCHSIVQSDGGGVLTVDTSDYKTPVWDNPASVQCGECHNADGTGNATWMDSGTHTTHVQVQFFMCTACHWYNGGVSQPADHPNNIIDIEFDPSMNPTGVYSQADNTPGNGYGYCSSLDCHGSGTPQWGTTNPTADCTWCHGNNASSASPMSLDNHPDHINNAAVIGDNFECAQCHDATVSTGDDRAITDRNVHASVMGVTGLF
jgi:predicted CxxxxCH...CXXCH cytochrome family protein